ncbi:hypothetical protein G1H11_00505 [Phytoactinopolyspora alkaliphila]|uniref:Uncharacterized protein n=1 Tax=Phytoactinopolyspora alkaliphila TaxID=1783498 RepID=A0A6N9YFP3_9ACTN|nr:hypothetical protein [Phytoactinopolyspora alkaliphila]NED93794.1 hypothetical protein [Phytoactinopolyspora alkaliphila]
MLRIETQRRDAVLAAAALRNRRQAAKRQGRRAASVRAASALRMAASAGTRSTR